MSTQFSYRLFSASWLGALVVCVAFTAACSDTSGPTDEAGAGSSFGGSTSRSGAGGAPGVAGAASVSGGGQFAASGAPGSSGGSGGNIQFAGAGGQPFGSSGASGGATAGSVGFGGHAGVGAGGTSSHAGQSSGGGSSGTTPTWTEIYTKFISNAQYGSNCNGGSCHNPGKQKNYDFSTQAKGYSSVKPNTSKVVSVLTAGSMPMGKPKMPAADLAIINAWIAAGALDN